MSRPLRRLGALVLLAASSAVLAPACAVNEGSLFIQYCMVRPPDTCAVSNDPTSVHKASGALDAAFGVGYSCALLVGNQMQIRGDERRSRVETSRVQIYAAEVTLLDQGGNIITRSDNSSAQYTIPVNGFVDPATSAAAPGYGLVEVLLLDPATAKDLGAQAAKTKETQTVVASVVLRGRTLGGTEVSTGEWTFPIDVCRGCLCNTTPCITNSTEEFDEAACDVGIDRAVDCRQNFSGCPDCRLQATGCTQ